LLYKLFGEKGALIMESTTLATILENIGTVFTSFVGYVGSVCETIVQNPLLLVGFCIPFVFAIISLVKRLF